MERTVRPRAVLDDDLISNNVNVKSNYLQKEKKNLKDERVWMCGAFDRSFFLRWAKQYQWEQETRIFVEAISFLEGITVRVCICVCMCIRVM